MLKKVGTRPFSWIGLLTLGLVFQPSPVQAEDNAPAEGYDYRNPTAASGIFEQAPPASSWSGMSTEQADKVFWDGDSKRWITSKNQRKDGCLGSLSIPGQLHAHCFTAQYPAIYMVPSFAPPNRRGDRNDGGSLS